MINNRLRDYQRNLVRGGMVESIGTFWNGGEVSRGDTNERENIMKEIKCTVITSYGTYNATYSEFDGITTEDIIEQLSCSGIYNITGIIVNA